MWSQFQALASDFVQVPTYHLLLESFLLFWILWLLARRFLQKRGQQNRADFIKLTKEEEEERLGRAAAGSAATFLSANVVAAESLSAKET